jgi:hypothetical protein
MSDEFFITRPQRGQTLIAPSATRGNLWKSIKNNITIKQFKLFKHL